jgi:hypothetical protein
VRPDILRISFWKGLDDYKSASLSLRKKYITREGQEDGTVTYDNDDKDERASPLYNLAK